LRLCGKLPDLIDSTGVQRIKTISRKGAKLAKKKDQELSRRGDRDFGQLNHGLSLHYRNFKDAHHLRATLVIASVSIAVTAKWIAREIARYFG
jgi:thymidylate synthase ThyX